MADFGLLVSLAGSTGSLVIVDFGFAGVSVVSWLLGNGWVNWIWLN